MTEISDAILQAARDVIPEGQLNRQFRSAGIKNEKLLVLLYGLLDASKVVASAIADNAFDDMRPVPANLAVDMRRKATGIAETISTTSPAGWTLSMTGKELL